MKYSHIIFLMIIFIASLASADDKAVQKYRNYTPQQIQKLPEKTRENVPMMYNFAAQKGLASDSELFFSMLLNRLMYSGVHDYKAAVKAFQKDMGDPATGILTVWQIHNLEQRADMQKLSRVMFPDQFSSFKVDNYASINGTMTILDERVAWPINHVQIKCYKDLQYCTFDQLTINVPNKDSWSQNYHVMQHLPETYTISNWTEDSIDAVPLNVEDKCRVTSLNLNFKTKEFYYITRNGGGDCNIMGMTLDKLTKPRIAQLVDGKKIFDEEFAKIDNAAYEVLSSEFRRKVESFSPKDTKK